MSKTWTEGMCNQTSGFLFKHECPLFPQNRCSICNKPVCEEHTKTLDGKTVCPDCEKAEIRGRGNQTNQNNPYYYDDPYYHYGTYYHGYGHYGPSYGTTTQGVGRANDPNDFQAGDAESLKHEGDDGFETDMNES